VFEALRAHADAATAKGHTPEAILVTLGPIAETRARVGFALGFFAAGGIRARETAEVTRASIACVCGTDERYATEAVASARALKAAGCGRVLVAGRPGALEGALRDAGVDGFIFVGCDTVAMLSELLQGLS
jgi:methylmalonyl-CoA mutase